MKAVGSVGCRARALHVGHVSCPGPASLRLITSPSGPGTRRPEVSESSRPRPTLSTPTAQTVPPPPRSHPASPDSFMNSHTVNAMPSQLKFSKVQNDFRVPITPYREKTTFASLLHRTLLDFFSIFGGTEITAKGRGRGHAAHTSPPTISSGWLAWRARVVIVRVGLAALGKGEV